MTMAKEMYKCNREQTFAFAYYQSGTEAVVVLVCWGAGVGVEVSPPIRIKLLHAGNLNTAILKKLDH